MARARDPDLWQAWRERLRRFRGTMETVAEFCRRERVSMAAFYQWRRKLSPGGGVRRSKDADIGPRPPGPRPQVRRYVDKYPQDYSELLQVRPGITDIASLKYRHEAEILGQYPDPEQAYVDVILPDKIALGKEYIRKSSLAFDIKLIIMTVLRMSETSPTSGKSGTASI